MDDKTDPPVSPVLQRDGTSQAGRMQTALKPDHVAVDERSIKDLLTFAREYAKQLCYYNVDNQPAEDWSGLLAQDLDELVAFIKEPDKFDKDWKINHARPHLVLLLTFLELLQHIKAQLNDLTRRHLEFYYREFLQLSANQSIPDHVHVWVELADGQGQFLLPQGSVLSAGRDSQGADLFYRTEQAIVANRATVVSFKNLFVKRQMIGSRDVRENSDLRKKLPVFDSLKDLPEPEKAFMCMLAIALGETGSGGNLATYPGTPNLPDLDHLDTLLRFIRNDLGLLLPAFRTLMQLQHKLELDREKDGRWSKINDILRDAGKQRDARFNWAFAEPDNFDKNLLAALGLESWDTFFVTLPEVNNIYDLYRLRERKDVESFIKDPNKLPMSFENFVDMMKLVDDIYKDWRQIYDILRAAGKKKKILKTLDPPNLLRVYKSDKFQALIKQTLGDPEFSGTIKSFDDCYGQVLQLESYFHMSAEDFDFIRQIHAKPEKQEAKPWEWEQVYSILEKAHITKNLPKRWEDLKKIHEADTNGFESMIQYAWGDPAPGDKLPESKKFMELDSDNDKHYIQEKLFLEPANFTYIQEIKNKEKPTEHDWAKVYQIVELAQSRKRGDQKAQIEIWENCYAATDATQLQVQSDLKEETVTPRWRTFGGDCTSLWKDLATPAATGFAIASPLLALAEGNRIITLTLQFSKDNFDEKVIETTLKELLPFRFWLSTQKKMVEVVPVPIKVANETTKSINIELVKPTRGGQAAAKYALQIILTLDPQFPPVEPWTVKPTIQTPWPILQILLADIAEKNDSIYRAFAALKLEKARIEVNVAGMTQLTLQNDNSVLNAKKPFEPFGFAPMVGSSFYFAHPELCSKKLDSLNLSIDWMGAPDSFNTHYRGYNFKVVESGDQPSSPVNNKSFTAKLNLFDNRTFFEVKDAGIELFDETNASKTKIIPIGGNKIQSAYPNYRQDLYPVLAEEVLNWNRYWQLELLAPDFQHAIYLPAATAYANRKKDNVPDPYVVNLPYTPKIKRLTMGYQASVEIDLAQKTDSDAVEQLYHVELFGYRELTTDDQHHWLPQYPNEGELFIGIKDLAPPQTLAALFQIAEGSADPDVAREPIHWHYLDDNRWEMLEYGKRLSDSTNGLLNSGIITFDLPPIKASTLLPPDLYWIRASIAKNCRSVGDIVGIHAQAVSAVFIDRNNAPDHLNQPLPANSITGLAEQLPAVKAIHQPYSSIGGKGPEQAGRFYTRVSERLRHKDRALTCWDYECMVLEAFPEIYKVKCLPVGTSDDPRLADDIKIIVIPDIRGKRPFDPFEPKAPADMLLRIKQYLKKQTSPLARFTVSNPTYIPLRVRLGVRFRTENNPGFYQQELEEALKRYLAPWAYDQSAEIVFGGKVNASLIVNFIERLPYVDYVAGIKLFAILEGKAKPEFTISPDAILVSDRQHVIDPITEEVYEEKYFIGINYMEVELDFEVA